MRLVYTTLARYAELSKDGTFTIIGGGFQRLRVSDFPVTVPTLALLIKIEADVKEHGDYRLELVLVDPNDARVDGGKGELPFSIDEDPDHREFTCLFQLYGLQFQRPGVHFFRIALAGGLELGSAKLSIELPAGERP